MPRSFVDDLPEYQIPGVNPPRPRMTTFSGQRFYPPAVTTTQHDGAQRQSRQNSVVIDPMEVSSTANIIVSPHLSLPVSPINLLENRAASVGWIQKLRTLSEKCTTCTNTAKIKLAESMIRIRTNVCKWLKCLFDHAMQMVDLLKRCTRNIIQFVAGSCLPTICVEV